MDTFDERQLLLDSFTLACDAVHRLVAAREGVDPPAKPFIERWWQATDAETQRGFRQGELLFRQRRHLWFLFADRLAEDATDALDPSVLRSAVTALVEGYSLVAQDRSADESVRSVALHAALRLSKEVHIKRSFWLKGKVEGTKRTQPQRWTTDALGLDFDEFDSLVAEIVAGRRSPRELREYDFDPPSIMSAAESLALAQAQPIAEATAPVYDRSDSKRRISSINIAHFRGSPQSLGLDFTKNGKPVSVLILGDNGTGKSTIADGIEFALQGRIGRSLAFESPLGPAARSLAVRELPKVVATLDDGTPVVRRLELRNGRAVMAGGVVRPGFRLAPITLKRQDILRFLDTGALARGHVFFDYFPTTVENMAIRPEELIERLEDEAFELRIDRARRAAWVASLWGLDEGDLKSDRIVAETRSRITGGLPLAVFDKADGWAGVDADIRHNVQALLHASQRLANIKKQRERGIETLNPVRYRNQVSLLNTALKGIGEDLTGAFNRIARAPYVEKIDVSFGKSGPVALDLIVQLSDGTHCFPQQVFSEGYRDLVAVLFFVVVAKRAAEHGQAKILILDDVFQSVDASIRRGVVEYLLDDLKDWQLIFTVHDRLWFEQLRTLFHQRGHSFAEHELRRWTFDEGPMLVAPIDHPGSAIRSLLTLGDVGAICGAAGRALEQASDRLSGRLGTSVTRRPDDKYTLNDLWPGVRKALKGTNLESLAIEVDRHAPLRNIVGAHYNEWATALSLEEAEAFGGAVLDFLDVTWCGHCSDWIERRVSSPPSCHCGQLRL